MLSVQEALGLDFLQAPSSSCGLAMPVRDQDNIITSGFTPWGPESCPSLDQVMMMAAAASSTTTTTTPPREDVEHEADEEEERRRRQRRKASNRLSAQRSRARKQQQLKELRAEAALLRAEKEGLAARLHALARHDLAVRGQNARLRAEAAALARRLREAGRILAMQRLAHQFLPPPPAPTLLAPAEHRQAAGAAAPAVGLASSLMI